MRRTKKPWSLTLSGLTPLLLLLVILVLDGAGIIDVPTWLLWVLVVPLIVLNVVVLVVFIVTSLLFLAVKRRVDAGDGRVVVNMNEAEEDIE